VIFEFKAPTIEAGRAQLMRYLSNEPMAKMGYWTNGERSLAIYKRPEGDWEEVEGAGLPGPDDDLTAPPKQPLTWETLRVPTETELAGALRRLLGAVVVGDTRSTRREDQLRELIHVVLVKLDSDAAAEANPGDPVVFRVYGDKLTRIEKTAERIRAAFRDVFRRRRTTIFVQDDRAELALDDATIYEAVGELARFRLLYDDVDVVSRAFQAFRAAALKSKEGQFMTPQRIIRPCIAALDIQYEDKVIDPACGTGGFLLEALRQIRDRYAATTDKMHLLVKWANERAFGVDIDDIGIKLTRAMMVAIGDGSLHTLIGDSLRSHRWREKFPQLYAELWDESAEAVAEQFTCVVTNPPFGEDLKLRAADARAAGFSIANAAAMRGPNDYVDLEIGLIFLERAWQLLQVGGRVGIVLPETYFFSHSYRWLPGWLKGRLELRGMLNIPMEAFQEWCRAKTNFYIFEKVGSSLKEREGA
jgi:type I restriction enzyme M protein